MKASWTPRNTYLYLVCLITLVIVVFAAVGLVRGLATLAYPEPLRVLTPSEAESGVLEADLVMQQRWMQRYAVLDLVRNAVLFLLAAPLYLMHWRRIERS